MFSAQWSWIPKSQTLPEQEAEQKQPHGAEDAGKQLTRMGQHCSGALHSSTGELLCLWQLRAQLLASAALQSEYLCRVLRVCRVHVLNRASPTLSGCSLAGSLVACCGCQRRSCRLLSRFSLRLLAASQWSHNRSGYLHVVSPVGETIDWICS